MSSTTAAKVAKVPPSSFSALLRRSKFASYDPHIGQIYTTYDGSAARGDWGLKRPLAVRRRDARLAVSSIDTLYQQTEWASAYSDTMWVRKFEEMGITPNLETEGSWAPRLGMRSKLDTPLWMRDSDYTETPPSKTEKDLELKAPTPDPRVMGPKRLERYLRKLRRLQPEFREFIESEDERNQKWKELDGLLTLTPSPAPKKPPLHKMAMLTSRDHTMFLGDKFAEACKAENPTVIRPMPHPTAGLTYVYSNELQTAVTAKPIPGRRLHYIPTSSALSNVPLNVAVGGWTSREEVKKKNKKITMTDWGTKEGEPRQDLQAGKEIFRPTECTLVSPPEVVGRYPQRLDATSIRMQVVSWADADKSRPNPHRPGTAEYVAHAEKDFTKRPVPAAQTPYRPYSSTYTMTNGRRKPIDMKHKASKEQASTLLDTLRVFVKETVDGKDPQDGKDPKL